MVPLQPDDSRKEHTPHSFPLTHTYTLGTKFIIISYKGKLRHRMGFPRPLAPVCDTHLLSRRSRQRGFRTRIKRVGPLQIEG